MVMLRQLLEGFFPFCHQVRADFIAAGYLGNACLAFARFRRCSGFERRVVLPAVFFPARFLLSCLL